ncbi:Dynein light chain 1, axonemal [Cladochytrium tenue]|nr:Dynein light chain 1, axonemal [Cladochytrium tenue]
MATQVVVASADGAGGAPRYDRRGGQQRQRPTAPQAPPQTVHEGGDRQANFSGISIGSDSDSVRWTHNWQQGGQGEAGSAERRARMARRLSIDTDANYDGDGTASANVTAAAGAATVPSGRAVSVTRGRSQVGRSPSVGNGGGGAESAEETAESGARGRGRAAYWPPSATSTRAGSVIGGRGAARAESVGSVPRFGGGSGSRAGSVGPGDGPRRGGGGSSGGRGWAASAGRPTSSGAFVAGRKTPDAPWRRGARSAAGKAGAVKRVDADDYGEEGRAGRVVLVANRMEARTGLPEKERRLFRACQEGDVDGLYRCLWDRADVNSRLPVVGTSPLSVAFRNGNKNLAHVLLAFGAKMTPDDYGATPVHWAVHNNQTSLVEAMIRGGHLSSGNLEVQDSFGSTPLHFASVMNLSEMTKLLIDAGVDPTTANNDGRRPRDLTTDTDIAELLAAAERRAAELAGPRPAAGAEQARPARKQSGEAGQRGRARPTSARAGPTRPVSARVASAGPVRREAGAVRADRPSSARTRVVGLGRSDRVAAPLLQQPQPRPGLRPGSARAGGAAGGRRPASAVTAKAKKQLALSTNQIEKISNLNGLSCLRILSLGRNSIKKIEGLDAVSETLEELWVSYNLIERLNGIECCKKLKVLYASNNKIKAWEGVTSCQALPALDEMLLVGNPLEEKCTSEGTWTSDISKKFPALKKLDGKPIIRDDELGGGEEGQKDE